jgi:hypothetical protein
MIVTDNGTVFSASRSSIETLPLWAVLPPVNFAISAAVSWLRRSAAPAKDCQRAALPATSALRDGILSHSGFLPDIA